MNSCQGHYVYHTGVVEIRNCDDDIGYVRIQRILQCFVCSGQSVNHIICCLWVYWSAVSLWLPR